MIFNLKKQRLDRLYNFKFVSLILTQPEDLLQLMIKRIALTLSFFLISLSMWAYKGAPPWSKTGHRVVGEVAQKYLSRKAWRTISELLEGETLAEVSNYGDAIKSDRAYARFSPWHYVNFPADKAYTEVTPSPQGDVVQGIEKCIAILKDPQTGRDEEVFYLKMLIHLIGDLHQPMHIGRAEDRGGNDIQVRWFGRGSNLHRVWDANLIDDYGMSYTELARTLPRWSRKKIHQIQQGSVFEWVEEIQEVTNRVYASAEVGEKLSYRYRYHWWDTVEEQLLTAGVRLAAVLNDIYG